MRGYGMSRRELFERLDRPALRTLPQERFAFAEWKSATVHLDYRIEFERQIPQRAVDLRAQACEGARHRRD